MSVIFLLLISYQLKHFLCDYPLQTRWMLGKFKLGLQYLLPLGVHAAVHFLGTILITLWFVPLKQAILMGLFDFVIHFVMDRVKASPRLLGRFKPLTAETAQHATQKQWRQNNFFWWALGFDQMVHHLTHYAIIWWVIQSP